MDRFNPALVEMARWSQSTFQATRMTLNICFDLGDELSDCRVDYKRAIDLIYAVETLFSRHGLMHEFRFGGHLRALFIQLNNLILSKIFPLCFISNLI